MLEKLPPSIGEGLHNLRAGVEKTVFNRIGNSLEIAQIQVTSSAFPRNGQIPIRHTADGDGVSPPLEWSGLPPSAESVLIIVEDSDSPTPQPLVHAIVVNLDIRLSGLEQGALNSPEHEGHGVQTGRNSYLKQAWLPPDPPPAHGIHRYLFQVFALRGGGKFSDAPGRDEVVRAIEEFAVAGGYLVGTYERAERVPAEQSVLESLNDASPSGALA